MTSPTHSVTLDSETQITSHPYEDQIMPEIAAVQTIADKWRRVTPQRVTDYQAGISSPKRNWDTATIAAEDAYNAGVTNAIARGAFATGARRVGNRKWEQNSLAKGVTRWPQGVNLAGADYAEGFAPYADVIANTTLPPRGPKGDPGNIERARVMAEALHNRKIQIQGG